jgi:hypothetical protein
MCTGKSPYSGFSKAKHGIYYQLHTLGESGRKACYGDYITTDIVYKTLSDSVFFSGRRKLLLEKKEGKGTIDKCFVMLNQGESATFIISADLFFLETLESELPQFIEPGGMIKVDLSIVEIQTEKEYELEKEAFLIWIEDFGEYERVILEQYLREDKMPLEPRESGLYYLRLRPGKGEKIVPGDTITVNYEGRFLNGRFFDSTIRRNQPFQFVYGTEWQVVEGLEEAIGMMREGEKSLFILPSELAFGTEGSSTGIIPPFTSLIFEVEIIKVN